MGAVRLSSRAASRSYVLLFSPAGVLSEVTTHGQVRDGGDEFTCMVLW